MLSNRGCMRLPWRLLRFLGPVIGIELVAAVCYGVGAYLRSTVPGYQENISVCMYFSCAGDPQAVIYAKIWETAGWCAMWLGALLLLVLAAIALNKRMTRE